MINRYEVKEIGQIWSEDNKFKYYLRVELAHLKTLEKVGLVKAGVSDSFKEAQINPRRISEIEKTTNHDVIAFCTSITEQFPSELGRFFHYGITSSDIIDTAHALMIKDSMDIVRSDLVSLSSVLKNKTHETSDLLCLGRSHGISAEAMIFGQKFCSFESELQRRIKEWNEEIIALTGKMSGAVGNYTIVSPEEEEETLKDLGLKVEKTSSQVIPRDQYAKIISVGALIGSLLERMATEFRLLQHSDVDEVREGFSKGQKGSSTMPHKKNPISSENITGIARLLRSHLTPFLENCALWHERDISHSSVERMIFPDHFGLLSYSIRRMKGVIENLVIDRERIESKAKASEKIYSSLVLHKLIELNPSQSRESIYEIVQHSFFRSNNLQDLKDNLKNDCSSAKLLHHCDDWINFDNLKDHYKAQFQKVLKRH